MHRHTESPAPRPAARSSSQCRPGLSSSRQTVLVNSCLGGIAQEDGPELSRPCARPSRRPLHDPSLLRWFIFGDADDRRKVGPQITVRFHRNAMIGGYFERARSKFPNPSSHNLPAEARTPRERLRPVEKGVVAHRLGSVPLISPRQTAELSWINPHSV